MSSAMQHITGSRNTEWKWAENGQIKERTEARISQKVL